jgi:hypothetical protein
MQRFIKYIPSEEAEYLLKYHPNAFLLFTLISNRARRLSGHPDGLEIGECFIGDYKNCGIVSEKQYRTAKKILLERGHIKIIETCRNRKKGATGRATIGTKVKLLSSTIWDINAKDEGDRKGDRGATEGRRTRMNKKEQEDKNKEKIKIKRKKGAYERSQRSGEGSESEDSADSHYVRPGEAWTGNR